MTLMSLQNQWECEKVRIMVIRNQPFEYIAGLIRPFLNYIGIEPVYSFSEYDDNIPDNELVYNEQDIIIIWIDFDLSLLIFIYIYNNIRNNYNTL